MIPQQDAFQETFVLNMGPQHPSTHGVLRVILKCDGEYVMEAEPVLGYGHRMHEKMGEVREHRGFYANVSRMDYAGPMSFAHGHILAVEKILGIEVPRRAEYIRVITTELYRVSSHLLWLGAFLLDLGAFTPILYAFDDREVIYDLMEDLAGARLTISYFRVGGVCRDVDENFLNGTKAFIKRLRSRMPMYHNLVSGNVIFQKRVTDVGHLPLDMALKYGCTGPVIRGSGMPYDVRKTEPYSVYPDFDFDIPCFDECDCMARYKVRMEEIEQSMRIVEQAIEKLPDDGYIAPKVPKVLKGAGEVYQAVEAARGSLGYYLACDNSPNPYRMKIRSPSYSNLSCLKELTRGILLSDLVAVMGSFDLVIPEIDR